MLWWYRLRDSRGWYPATFLFVCAVFAGGYWAGGRDGGQAAIEGYRRNVPTSLVPTTIPPSDTTTTTTMAPSTTLVPLPKPELAATISMNDVLTEAARNSIERPTLEMTGRFFDTTVAVGLLDADGDGVDDDGTFTYLVGGKTMCVRLWSQSGPGVTEGACQ